MKKKLVFIALTVLSVKSFGQTYTTFTNLKFSSPLISNPALTGLGKTPQLNFKFSHFYGLNRTYLDYNQYSNKLHGGLGVYFNAGRFELYKESFSYFGFNYAYQNKITDKWNYSIGAGVDFSGSYGYSNGTSYSSLYFNYHLGGLLYTKKFFMGITAKDLYKKYSKSLNFSFGYQIQPFKNKAFYITPSLQFSNQYNSFSISSVDLNLKYKNFSIGGGYQRGFAYLNLGYDFNRFRVNYSLGKFNNWLGEDYSHEFAIKFKLNNKKQQPKSLRFNANLF